MFQLTIEEVESMVSQNVTPTKKQLGGHLPYAFTEQGVAMLSSVLRSKRAIEVNIMIMRAFVSMRELLLSNEELNRRLDELEKKYDSKFQVVFQAIRELVTQDPAPPPPTRRPIGFGRE